jgi:hypothetical protein
MKLAGDDTTCCRSTETELQQRFQKIQDCQTSGQSFHRGNPSNQTLLDPCPQSHCEILEIQNANPANNIIKLFFFIAPY